MPAAAVIPAPIAYTNVVAVKKLVVGFQNRDLNYLNSMFLFFIGTNLHLIYFRCCLVPLLL